MKIIESWLKSSKIKILMNDDFVTKIEKYFKENIFQENVCPWTWNVVELIKKYLIFNFYLRSNQEILKSAEERLGETEYNILFDNCQHFCFYCRYGIGKSPEVKLKHFYAFFGSTHG